MAFTLDQTTDRGKVRLLIYDITDGVYKTDYNFSDADVDAFLELNSDDVWASAADACRSLAVLAAGSAFALTIPGALELDKKQISARYMALADGYQARAQTSSSNVVEYIDSYAIEIDQLGIDKSEYVGD